MPWALSVGVCFARANVRIAMMLAVSTPGRSEEAVKLRTSLIGVQEIPGIDWLIYLVGPRDLAILESRISRYRRLVGLA